MLVQSLHKVWNSVIIGRLNFFGNVVFVRKLRFVAYANIAPHQSAQVIIQSGTRYVEFFSFFRRFNFRFGPFGFFRFSISISISFRIRLKKMWRLSIDNVSIASRQISLRARLGDPGVFHSRCQRFNRHMSYSSVLLGRQILRSAPHL